MATSTEAKPLTEGEAKLTGHEAVTAGLKLAEEKDPLTPVAEGTDEPAAETEVTDEPEADDKALP
ncbi:hypothetical protein LCGC14_1608610, partial [marine sediment metagenome]